MTTAPTSYPAATASPVSRARWNAVACLVVACVLLTAAIVVQHYVGSQPVCAGLFTAAVAVLAFGYRCARLSDRLQAEGAC